MTKHQTGSRRTSARMTLGLALTAALAIGACGSASAAQDSAGAGRNQSARLRILNEALYPDTAVATSPERFSRLRSLNETLYPDEIAPWWQTSGDR